MPKRMQRGKEMKFKVEAIRDKEGKEWEVVCKRKNGDSFTVWGNTLIQAFANLGYDLFDVYEKEQYYTSCGGLFKKD